MTWIFGWPYHTDFAYQYAQDRQLFPNQSDVNELTVIDAVLSDLLRRSGLSIMNISIRICWVDDDTECVIALYVNHRARTIERARETVRASRMPRKDCAFRLGALMGYEGPPRWYRDADDGSRNPKDGVVSEGSEEESDSESDSSEEEGEDEDEDEEEGSETQREDEGESTEVEAAENDASETYGCARVGAEDRRTYASVGIQVEDVPSRSHHVCEKCAGERTLVTERLPSTTQHGTI
ncbi:hypothetical protein B0H21DRAFT_97280 [Amylocystis lapponica]|nr:hypothetical protein B0H21DRAFT_97280 [Amylocystis lapponica]